MKEKEKKKNPKKIASKEPKTETTTKSYLSATDMIKSFNNVLIAHKTEDELNEYRRVFYSLFGIFCGLFLLCLLGLWYVKYNYKLQIFALEQRYITQIEQIEFSSELQLEAAKLAFFLDHLDFDTDDSITKYTDPQISFNNLGYIPADLVSVAGEYIQDAKGGYIQIQAIAKQNLDLLAEQFYNETQQQLVVVSGYRSYSYQKGIKDGGCPDNLCAKAGYSEHQGGYAVDLYSASTQADWMSNNTLKKYFDWLNANAHVYGFTNTYQKGVEIDGYDPEPWHWRYVGVELATHLRQQDLTFAEFYYSKK